MILGFIKKKWGGRLLELMGIYYNKGFILYCIASEICFIIEMSLALILIFNKT